MGKKRFLLIIILFVLAVSAGCIKNEQKETTKESDTEKQTEASSSNNTEGMTKTSNNSINASNAASNTEDHFIEGKVLVKEKENVIRVDATTNLVEDTVVKVNVMKAFGELSSPIGKTGPENGKVKKDGKVDIDYPLDDDFFDKYSGEQIIVDIQVNPSPYDDELREAYGKKGEKFTGPFVYQVDFTLGGELEQRLLAPVYIQIGNEKTEYTIEALEREPLPDDYGNTDIWIEAEIADNDHQYLYVEGKSNLLEGLQLQGRYFSDEEATFSQASATKMFVEPDGTFMLPVKYDSVTSDGYIEIRGIPIQSHRTKHKILEEYGEDYEHLTGNVVKEVDDHQEILMKIEREGTELDAPENSLITEADGELKIQVPDDVLFDFDKSSLKENAKETLNEVIDILEEIDKGELVQINGHTDNEGDAEYNLKLSEERAASVEEYLSKHGDIDDIKIEKKGYGETQPVESNEKEDGRKRNRRVEIVFNENN